MHYYQFNIADYRKDTAHLTPLEHYIYRQLMDSYYLDEKPIPKETRSVIRRLGLGLDGLDMFNNVLSDFFFLVDDEWHHKRIDAEIDAYHGKVQKNKENGKKGGRPKKQPLSGENKPKKTQSVNLANPSESESKPNQEPLTNNHKPLTINKEPVKEEKNPTLTIAQMTHMKPTLVTDDTWAAYIAMRRRKKAAKTLLGMNGVVRDLNSCVEHGVKMEDMLIMCIEKEWKGINHEWYLNAKGGQPSKQNKPTFNSMNYGEARDL